jgi:hypothetical protein
MIFDVVFLFFAVDFKKKVVKHGFDDVIYSLYLYF